MSNYLCLICDQEVMGHELLSHKTMHPETVHYGIMWPPAIEVPRRANGAITHELPCLAEALGVRQVYVRDEGHNPSGSMKDYTVQQAIALGQDAGKSIYYVISSGNHAYSLCKFTQAIGAQAVVFTTGTSSKIPFLASFPGVLVVAVEGEEEVIFEDVYNLVQSAGLESIPGLYNANVNNERLLTAFSPIARDIMDLNPAPTHILAGAGNGSYLAGIGYGLACLGANPMPRIVSVGMAGAFPTEHAHVRSLRWHKQDRFLVPECLIDAAEGSIATESYSMPQLLHAMKISRGFTMCGLENKDLAKAYQLIARNEKLVGLGLVPEPTGIMSLAAALKWRLSFQRSDILYLSFTGHGIKDMSGICRLVEDEADRATLRQAAERSRPDLLPPTEVHPDGRVVRVPKSIDPQLLREIVREHCAQILVSA